MNDALQQGEFLEIPLFIAAPIYAGLEREKEDSGAFSSTLFWRRGSRKKRKRASSDVLLATKWAFRWGKAPYLPSSPSRTFLKCGPLSVNFSPLLRSEFFVTSLPHL